MDLSVTGAPSSGLWDLGLPTPWVGVPGTHTPLTFLPHALWVPWVYGCLSPPIAAGPLSA